MSEKIEPITDEEMPDAKTSIRRARDTIYQLCDGRMRWTMRVPADPAVDPDLILSDAVTVAEKSIARIEADRDKIVHWKAAHATACAAGELIAAEIGCIQAENEELVEAVRSVASSMAEGRYSIADIKIRDILAKHDAQAESKAEQGKELES